MKQDLATAFVDLPNHLRICVFIQKSTDSLPVIPLSSFQRNAISLFFLYAQIEFPKPRFYCIQITAYCRLTDTK